MDESAAREILLLQAFESATSPGANWTEEDQAWATRLALQGEARGPGQGRTGGGPEDFLAARARHAMQRLLPREPSSAKWLERRLWRPAWVGWAAVVGLISGLLADSIGSSQRINLLAPPVWTIVAWNLVVYLLLAGSAFRQALVGPGRPGRPVPPAKRARGAVRLVERAMRWGRSLPALDASAAPALRTFAVQWGRLSAPLSALRAATLLHAAAATLGLGLIAGMYARGLVLDYRAAWESTFLSADSVHAVLATVLAPASALSGIAVPDAAGVAALQAAHASAGIGASAAPWIHLYAVTLIITVVLPRGVLALTRAWRARRLASHLPLPLSDLYFQRLLLRQRGDAAVVQVLPYAQAPSASSTLGLRTLLTEAFGHELQCQLAPTTSFGAEDDGEAAPAWPTGTTLVVALFDMVATPEVENHGRFVRGLATAAGAGTAVIMLVDEAAFLRRFLGDKLRLTQRRDAWRKLAETLGTAPVLVDLASPDLAAGGRALQAAIASPVNRESR